MLIVRNPQNSIGNYLAPLEQQLFVAIKFFVPTYCLEGKLHCDVVFYFYDVPCPGYSLCQILMQVSLYSS